jgi:hypothetical protein
LDWLAFPGVGRRVLDLTRHTTTRLLISLSHTSASTRLNRQRLLLQKTATSHHTIPSVSNAFIYLLNMNHEILEDIRSLKSQKEEWQSESIIVRVENEDGPMTNEDGTPLTANLVDYIGRASSPRIPVSQRGRKIHLANFDSDEEDYRRTKLIPFLIEACRPYGSSTFDPKDMRKVGAYI